MSKRIHMLCNAHIDPVWQWEWEEGAAETLSTFRIAADFCEEYDDFVFCHNEALLYRWVEEYDPALFARIQALVKAGKWNIIGGWHLQPDCNMPSGEAMVRQIFSGRQYFKEKFDVLPTVAFNADPFGHSRGLVQIMAKSGYEGYLFMRPWPEFLDLPGHDFRWVGYDGSSVIGIRMEDGYSSSKGHALEKIKKFETKCGDNDLVLCLWGVGNHGGGPSKKDLEDITAYKKQLNCKTELLHSTAEKYLEEVKQRRTLEDVEISLNPWGPGCYTTMTPMKRRYRQAENVLFITERICSHAAVLGLIEYPEKEILDAVYDILTIQFHDTLPGTSIQPSEVMALRFLDHALENLSRVRARAFFALCSGQKKADPDAIPIMIYNPFPYPLEGDFTCEFNLWDQVRNFVFLQPTVYSGEIALPTQCEKEASTIPIEWRKRVAFHTTLEPMTVNRFDCKFTTLPHKPERQIKQTQTHYIFESKDTVVQINKATGLIDSFVKNGQSILAKDSFALNVYEDDFDPWGMTVRGWDKQIGQFSLLSDQACAEYLHVNAPLPALRVIEQGDVRTVLEAVFGYKDSKAVVQYILSETDGMQLVIRLQWNEKQKLLKLAVPAAFRATSCLGEQLYGSEPLRNGMKEECCIQKYVAVIGEECAFALPNAGSYGVSFDDATGILYPTLLRSPSYCAHPIDDRTVMPQDRFCPYTDQGEHIVKFEFTAGTPAAICTETPRKAQEMNEGTVSLSFYPSGNGELPQPGLILEGDSAVQLTTFKKAEVDDGYIVRLFNSADTDQRAMIHGFGAEKSLTLKPYEIVTLRLNNGIFSPADLMEGLLNQ
jgi:alpha-mannosidase